MNTSVQELLDNYRKGITSSKELEYFDTHVVRYKKLLNKIVELQLPKDSKILDIGCFPPHLFDLMRELGYSVYGIASKHEPIKRPTIHILNIETDNLSFKENYFDLVLFTEVIEHLVVSPSIYLTKIKKILKNNGSIIISTPNAAGLHKVVKVLLGKSTYFDLDQLYNTKMTDGSLYHRHNREFTKDELVRVLEREGFSIHVMENWIVYSPFRKKSLQDTILIRAIKFFAYSLELVMNNLRDTIYIEALNTKR